MSTPGSINAGGGNAGGPDTPLPAGSTALNQPRTPTPPTSGSTTNPAAATNNLSIYSLTQPAPLKTFIYAPQVRIVIAHGAVEYDVSADMVRCQLLRPENSAATFWFTLHNKGLRYTPPGMNPFFSRMDRVIVYMKKTGWNQVFAGYLDQVPFKQLYAGTVEFKATCTVKRLMHTWWDPALPQANSLLNQVSANFSVDGLGQSDSGMGTMLRNLLINVGGWNVTNVHIQNFPTSFLQFLMTQIAQMQGTNAPNLIAFTQNILGSGNTSAPGAYAGANPNSGVPGPTAPTGLGLTGTGTAFYVSQIVAACDAKGMGPQVQDNNQAAALTQAGTTGMAPSMFDSPNDQKAWQQIQALGASQMTANRASDGAILGVACAMVSTGGGTIIRNLSNPSVPGSDGFPNDGPGTSNQDVGIFQQGASVGTLSQRMNPQQAAGMFFASLQAVSGWRNMDPGQAIQMAQNSSNASAALFDAAVALATTTVQAYRTSGMAAISSVVPSGTITGSSAITSATGALGGGLGGAPSASANAIVGAATTMPSPISAISSVNPLAQAAPQPNSEGAINFARTQLGCPYVWGATGPGAYDCSGLMLASFKSIGVQLPRTTQGIAGSVQRIPNASVQRGDLVEPSSGHVVLWLGDGTIIEAQQTGVPVHIIPNPYGPPSSWYGVFRACSNGGPDPTAPFSPPATMGPGTPPGALNQTGAGASGGTQAAGATNNLYSYIFSSDAYASTTAGMFTGTKAFIEGQPLIQMVQAVAAGSLRCWSSAPNGDLMFWYPDYWGLDGKPAVMLLADIEMKDCHIDFSDEPLTTHVYVNGDLSMTGSLQDPIQGWITTAGVATVEQPWLYARLISVAPGDLESALGQEIMQRFGVRPMQQSFAMAGTTELEFLLACQLFMEQWAKQYLTTIAMTFMPELFPGMRVELPGRDLQVYIHQVSHTCDYEQGFLTQVTISAPSNINARSLMGTTTSAAATVSTANAPAPATQTVGSGV